MSAHRLFIISKLSTQHCHESRKRHLRRPHFSKGLTKLAIFPDYERPGLICLALPPRQKFGLILVIKRRCYFLPFHSIFFPIFPKIEEWKEIAILKVLFPSTFILILEITISFHFDCYFLQFYRIAISFHFF